MLAVFIILLILCVVGVPMVFGIGLSAVVGLIISDIPLTVVAQRMFTMLDSFSLLAIPFFALAGNLMDKGGISIKIINFSSALVGHIRGGLGMVSVVASMIFGSISGSGAAASAAIGSTVIPSMKKKGYDDEFSAAITSVSGPLGVIIPPSVVMIIFAISANVSIGKLFVAGYIPGILIGLALCITVYILALKKGYPAEEKATPKQLLHSFFDSVWAILMIVIIIGGILGGFFTATEAAVVAVVYAIIVGIFIHKELTFKDLPKIFFDSALTSAAIMFVVAATNILAWLMTSQQVATKVTNALLSFTDNIFIILLLINIILLFLGMILDSTPAIILIVPILLPIVVELGIDPIHFGIITIVNLAIGMSTPPVGLTMFVSSAIAKVPIAKMVKPTVPFWIAMFIILILITYVPGIVMFLPNLIGG